MAHDSVALCHLRQTARDNLRDSWSVLRGAPCCGFGVPPGAPGKWGDTRVLGRECRRSDIGVEHLFGNVVANISEIMCGSIALAQPQMIVTMQGRE